MASLKLFHVNKVYDGGVHAVKDFCLEVEDGQFVVFVGPSGCGKSTTLRMIAGLEKISSGDAYIGDRLVNGLPAKERNIAMVFQNYALFPNMSVYDNISYGLRMRGEDKEVIREKVMHAAEMLNLQDHLNRKPSQLSGGQRQRVALGRAIVRNPDLFLLDEPLSNLDAKLRNKMRAEIMSLHRRLNATFVYVTHDQVEAMTMGDKIVVMKDGLVMQVGSPTQLYRHPANKFVAGFIGTPQMNFWEGTVEQNGKGFCVHCPLGVFPLTGELALRLDDSAKIPGKRVILGLRPEDVSVTRRRDTDVEITAKIRVVEDFCTYGIFYAETEGLEVVGQDAVGLDWMGKTAQLYACTERLHLFDAETENSVLPQYAPVTVVTAQKQGSKLTVLGDKVDLPPQLLDLPDGELTLRIPAEALVDGDISTRCDWVLDTENGPVSLLRFEQEALYAMGDFSRTQAVGLDMSRVEVMGQAQPIPRTSALSFTYLRRKQTVEGKTVMAHFCRFDGTETESYYEFNKKMYRLGKRIFRDRFQMHIAPEQLRLAVENECYPCIQGQVEAVTDYGPKQYSKVAVGRDTLYVPGKLRVGEQVSLAVDMDRVHVTDMGADSILF